MLTPLLLAAREVKIKACEALLKNKADPCATDLVCILYFTFYKFVYIFLKIAKMDSFTLSFKFTM